MGEVTGGIGLVVVRGEAYLSLRVLLPAVIVGDFTLGLAKQTLYTLFVALAAGPLCAAADPGAARGALALPRAFDVVEAIFAALIALVLLRVGTRQLRCTLERADAAAKSDGGTAEPAAAADAAAVAVAAAAAHKTARRRVALLALRGLLGTSALAALYVLVLRPLLRRAGSAVVALLVRLRARPAILSAVLVAIQPANYVVPFGGGTLSRLLLVCLLEHVPTVPLRALAAAGCYSLFKLSVYVVVPPVYWGVHLPLLHAIERAPAPLSDLARPFRLFITVAHGFLLGGVGGRTADTRGGTGLTGDGGDGGGDCGGGDMAGARCVTDVALAAVNGAPASDGGTRDVGGGPVDVTSGAAAEWRGARFGERGDASSWREDIAWLARWAGLAPDPFDPRRTAGAHPAHTAAAAEGGRRGGCAAALPRAARAAARANEACGRAWLGSAHACAAVCRAALALLRCSPTERAIGERAFWMAVLPGAEDKLSMAAWLAPLSRDDALAFAGAHGAAAANALTTALAGAQDASGAASAASTAIVSAPLRRLGCALPPTWSRLAALCTGAARRVAVAPMSLPALALV
ncbi:hypothetical protein KFE25_002292 [Diacronema lutheri]|uniref:Uncharacterized protein n=1 Tax=Diacronema lutheri TaxID=2081491 RepID=A0A8J6C7G2_DIALT|nr:hypothetical protein KFE25_002292 [Diacronema lutheri]